LGSKFITPILRSRDLLLFFKGDLYTVTPDSTMLAQGWAGGQGVMWTPGYNDERTVTFSDGRYGGIILWGSDENADQFMGITGTQTVNYFAVFAAGGNLLTTRTYERYTYASRTLGGPLVPLVYTPNQILYYSRRGWFTNEDESVIPPALPFAPNFFVGFVVQIPREDNDWFLGVQTSM